MLKLSKVFILKEAHNPKIQKVVDAYAKQLNVDPSILWKMAQDIEKAEGESVSDLEEATNIKMYDLYRKNASSLERDKNISDKLRGLAQDIDNLGLDQGFAFEIQRAYGELAEALARAIVRLPAQTTIQQTRIGYNQR